jgi:hypothetical protein
MVIVLLGQISSTSPESFFSTGLCRAGMDFPFIYPPALCLLLGFHALAFKAFKMHFFSCLPEFLDTNIFLGADDRLALHTDTLVTSSIYFEYECSTWTLYYLDSIPC